MLNRVNDKILHFIAGGVVAAPVGFLADPVLGLAMGAVAGLAKEVRDQITYGGFDVADLFATVAGAAVAAGAVVVLAPSL